MTNFSGEEQDTLNSGTLLELVRLYGDVRARGALYSGPRDEYRDQIEAIEGRILTLVSDLLINATLGVEV